MASHNKRSGPTKGRTKNKHWKFIKETIRQMQLAKTILPGSSSHHSRSRFVVAAGEEHYPHARTPESSISRRGRRPDYNIRKRAPTPPNVSHTIMADGEDHDDGEEVHNHASFATSDSESTYDDGDGMKKTRNNKSTLHSSLEDARQHLLAQAYRRRRLVFLQQTSAEEEFICQTLGMDKAYGNCTRHPNQPITANPQTLLMGMEYSPVKTCKICQSEMRAGPGALQSSCANLQGLGDVIAQVRKLQSNTNEWDKRTKLLGASLRSLNNSSHRSGTIGSMSSVIPEEQPFIANHIEHEFGDFAEDGSISINDLQESLHNSIHSISSHKERNNMSSLSSINLSEEEWAEQLKHRIVQVRAWDDRFAMKESPDILPIL